MRSRQREDRPKNSFRRARRSCSRRHCSNVPFELHRPQATSVLVGWPRSACPLAPSAAGKWQKDNVSPPSDALTQVIIEQRVELRRIEPTAVRPAKMQRSRLLCGQLRPMFAQANRGPVDAVATEQRSYQMRSMYGVFAVVVVCGLVSMAAGSGPCWGNHAGCAGCGAYGGYSAPACGAPGYGLAPGCCEFPPSCCQHVWDGYCQERAMWLSRCCGAGAFRGGSGYCGGGTTCGCVEPASAVTQGVAGVIAEEPAVAPTVEVSPPSK